MWFFIENKDDIYIVCDRWQVSQVIKDFFARVIWMGENEEKIKNMSYYLLFYSAIISKTKQSKNN